MSNMQYWYSYFGCRSERNLQLFTALPDAVQFVNPRQNCPKLVPPLLWWENAMQLSRGVFQQVVIIDQTFYWPA